MILKPYCRHQQNGIKRMGRRKFWLPNEEADLILAGLDLLFCSAKITEAAQQMIMRTSRTIYDHKASARKTADPETKREYNRNYAATHKERANELRRLGYQNPINKEKERIRHIKYYKENRVSQLERGRQYYQFNKEKILKQKMEYRTRPYIQVRIKENSRIYWLNQKLLRKLNS